VSGQPWIGHKFEAKCSVCGDGFDDFVFGMNIGNRVSDCRFRRNDWVNDHCAATGHKLFEIVNSQYHRLELLAPTQATLGAELQGSRKELEL
jgi:hypothetical protein